MDTIDAIFSKHPSLLSLFVITPDETVAHAWANGTRETPACPLHHLNRFYHDAARLLPAPHEVCLSVGTTRVTLRPLPLDWILAVHHRPNCGAAALDALQAATHPLAKTMEELEAEAFAILTPDALMAGELGRWLIPLMRLLEEVTETPPQALFHTALNDWIDREDPGIQGLPRFSAILAEAIPDTVKGRLFAEKAKGIFASERKDTRRGMAP